MKGLYTMPKTKNLIFRKIIEEMHKKMIISSLFFCAFALKYKLDFFLQGNKRYIICESCIVIMYKYVSESCIVIMYKYVWKAA